MRASYKRAIDWIANEDGDADVAARENDMNELSRLLTVVFVADLFGKSCEEVARAVKRAVMKS